VQQVGVGGGRLVGVAGGIPSKVLTELGNLGALLVQDGKDLVQGLISGIDSMLGSLGAAVGRVAALAAKAGAAAAQITSSSGIGRASTSSNIRAFATGGRIAARQLAIVGEHGPELFVPNVAGTILPNPIPLRRTIATEVYDSIQQQPQNIVNNYNTFNVTTPANERTLAAEMSWQLQNRLGVG